MVYWKEVVSVIMRQSENSPWIQKMFSCVLFSLLLCKNFTNFCVLPQGAFEYLRMTQTHTQNDSYSSNNYQVLWENQDSSSYTQSHDTSLPKIRNQSTSL